MILRRYAVAYAKRRVGGDGAVRYTAVYLDPRGRERSAGTFDGKRAAEKAARLAEGSIAIGGWIDPAHARMTFRTKIWLPAVSRTGIGYRLRMHDLRHAHASWALAGGADLKAVIERMGHRQLSTTQRYLHTLPDSDDRALAAFHRVRSS